eukprot:CAMPEP_0170199522 /NCGR_PEP_ID=MMETSP0040_2-20121228/69385_1 /TAXON_ID=641309 /ORGANISM="Lotharella oceanica, Strain CCMP622" /LENGTH=389 /DNA_ID=CAMNT_0010449653 /DNA_START=192 /DNA_END=1361 /DNA_ORIENTATION=-
MGSSTPTAFFPQGQSTPAPPLRALQVSLSPGIVLGALLDLIRLLEHVPHPPLAPPSSPRVAPVAPVDGDAASLDAMGGGGASPPAPRLRSQPSVAEEGAGGCCLEPDSDSAGVGGGGGRWGSAAAATAAAAAGVADEGDSGGSGGVGCNDFVVSRTGAPSNSTFALPLPTSSPLALSPSSIFSLFAATERAVFTFTSSAARLASFGVGVLQEEHDHRPFVVALHLATPVVELISLDQHQVPDPRRRHHLEHASPLDPQPRRLRVRGLHVDDGRERAAVEVVLQAAVGLFGVAAHVALDHPDRAANDSAKKPTQQWGKDRMYEAKRRVNVHCRLPRGVVEEIRGLPTLLVPVQEARAVDGGDARLYGPAEVLEDPRERQAALRIEFRLQP